MASFFTEKQGTFFHSKDDVSVTTVCVEPVDQDDEAPLAHTEQAPELAWQPGFKARFPWMSLACFLVVISCSVSAVLVLWRADHQPAKIWYKHVRPNVILSMLGSITNIFITAAVGQAVAIAWWRRALKGTTVEELHHSWSFSTSFTSILMQYRYFNVLALAALMTKFTLIDGILFQQSLSSYTRLGSAQAQTFFGYATADFPQTAAVYPNGTVENIFGLFDALLPWRSSSNEIENPQGFQQCLGVCAAKITTIGFIMNCDTVTENVDLVAQGLSNGTNGTHWTVFEVNFETFSSTVSKNYSYIQAEVTTYTRQNVTVTDGSQYCPAALEKRTCEFRPALINYPVAMQMLNTSTSTDNSSVVETKVMLGEIDEFGVYKPTARDWHDGMTQLNGFELNRTLDFPDLGGDGTISHSRLAGITQVLNESFTGHGYVNWIDKPDGGWEMASQGQYANIEYAGHEVFIQPVNDGNDYNSDPDDNCPGTYGNPIGDILFSLNTLMFLLSDMSTSAVNTTAAGSEMQEEVYYAWKWHYTIAAVACTVFCILCILPAYWGFWELGRKVTLGPFEIANAFEAPVLAHVYPTGSGQVDDVLLAAGQESVRYAARDVGGEDEHRAERYFRLERRGGEQEMDNFGSRVYSST